MATSKDYYFVIVGPDDSPLYEADYSSNALRKVLARAYTCVHPHLQRDADQLHLTQLVAFAALDIVDDQLATTTSMQLKIVDKFNDWFVSAFVTASSESLPPPLAQSRRNALSTFAQCTQR
jgi:hypothetical protein